MELSEELATNEYIRQRLSPRAGDLDYLCLIDLLNAVKTMAPLNTPHVLDYGCGGSPLRLVFSRAVYRRAAVYDHRLYRPLDREISATEQGGS